VSVLEEIVSAFPASDVADDALFELSFFYQITDNYQKAIETYTRLIEQYPFGTSSTNGIVFLELSKKQLRIMRSEIKSALALLGFETKNLPEALKIFQTRHHRAATGEADAETVTAIKEECARIVDEKAKTVALETSLQKSTIVVFLIATVIIGNLILLLAVWIKRKTLAARVAVLRNTFLNLNEGTL
jgi:tetratricopeptide (TPR) repeat protein